MSCVSCVPPYLTLRGLIFFKSKYWVSCYSLLQPQLFTRKGNIKFSPSEFLQPLMLILLSRLFFPRTKDLYYLIFIDFFLSPTLLFFMVCCWGEIKADLSQNCSYLFTRLISAVWSDFSKQRLGCAGRPTETSKHVRFLVITPPPHPVVPPPEEIIWHSLQEPIFHWYLIWGITSVGWY